MDAQWCPVCCTIHAGGLDCPGELQTTGPEAPGWRVNVATARGVEAYGVLIAQCGDVWRARIMTFPNVLWKAPGTPGTMKFVGANSTEAIDHAISFIRHHCHERGYALRNARSLDSPRSSPGLSATGRPLGPKPRKIRFLPIRFGSVQPSEPGGTGHLSEPTPRRTAAGNGDRAGLAAARLSRLRQDASLTSRAEQKISRIRRARSTVPKVTIPRSRRSWAIAS
jgi:hypothetical protein